MSFYISSENSTEALKCSPDQNISYYHEFKTDYKDFLFSKILKKHTKQEILSWDVMGVINIGKAERYTWEKHVS